MLADAREMYEVVVGKPYAKRKNGRPSTLFRTDGETIQVLKGHLDGLRNLMSSHPAYAARLGVCWMPLVDIVEGDEEWTLRMDLPGVSRGSLRVSVADQMIVVAGERRTEAPGTRDNFRRRERIFGPFERTLVIPVVFDADQAKASFLDGVLELSLPKVTGGILETARREVTVQ